ALVPAGLLDSTIEAATAVAAGRAAAALISPTVAALKEGVMKAMLLKKLTTVVTLVLVVTLLGSGGAQLAHRSLGAEQKGPPPEGQLSATAPDKADKKERLAGVIPEKETSMASARLLEEQRIRSGFLVSNALAGWSAGLGAAAFELGGKTSAR